MHQNVESKTFLCRIINHNYIFLWAPNVNVANGQWPTKRNDFDLNVDVDLDLTLVLWTGSWHLGCGYMSKAPQGVGQESVGSKREIAREQGERERAREVDLPKRRTKIL